MIEGIKQFVHDLTSEIPIPPPICTVKSDTMPTIQFSAAQVEIMRRLDRIEQMLLDRLPAPEHRHPCFACGHTVVTKAAGFHGPSPLTPEQKRP